MSFIKIDLDQYDRRQHFEYFSSLQYPYVGITSDVDVSELVRFCKAKNYSFYLTFLHAAALAADGVKELRQRIHNGGIIEYSECPTSHIELLDNNTYCYCTLHHHTALSEYIPYAVETRNLCRQNGSIDEDEDVESMYFISTFPWRHYTAMIQPVAGGEESTPRITWGKFQEDHHGKLQLPVTLLAHHALVDGIHIAMFYQNLEREIQKLLIENGG